MRLEDLKLSNGIECIRVDEKEKVIDLIVPEGWTVFAIPTDSGQNLVSMKVGLGIELRPHRMTAAPTVVIPPEPIDDVEGIMPIRILPPTERKPLQVVVSFSR